MLSRPFLRSKEIVSALGLAIIAVFDFQPGALEAVGRRFIL
jgi:hypothetical protein